MKLFSSKKWKTVRLGDIAVFNYGKALTQVNRTSGAYPVYGSSGITGSNDEPLINEVGYIIGRKGTVGSIYFSEKPFWPIDTVYYVTQKDLKCNFRFFYYLLKTLGLDKLNFDSAVPGLNREMVYSLELKIPESFEEQKQIADVLDSLDDKIEFLRKENSTLENICQAVFKEWFIDFKFPGSTGKTIDSELGKVPEGWMVEGLGNIAKVFSGKRPEEISKIQNITFPYPLVGASKAMGYVKQFIFDQEVFVIGRVGTHGVIQRFLEKIWPSDNTLILYSDYPEYLYQTLKLINFESLNKGAVQPLITQSDIKAFKIVIPDQDVINSFEKNIQGISYKVKNNNLEIKSISKLKDNLINKIFKDTYDR